MLTNKEEMTSYMYIGPRSIGQIDPVDPAIGMWRSDGSHRLARPKQRSKSIQ